MTPQSVVNELRRESATTKRLLERTPEDKLFSTPHPKSMSLGQLALHVATIPGNLSRMAQVSEFDATAVNFDPPAPNNKQEILDALSQSIEDAAGYLSTLTSQDAEAPWPLTHTGNEIFTMPRIELLRSILLNHWYLHRGQLTVYLRLLDIPLPVIYGRSADESPWPTTQA